MVDIDKIFSKAQEAFDKKNYDYAIDLSKHILEMDPSHAEARYIIRASIVKSYEIKTGSIPNGTGAALSAFIPMVKLFFYGLLNKKTLDVINTCEAYLAKNPISIWGRTRLASVLYQMNYVDSAIREYEGIIGLAPDHLPSLKALGELYRSKEDVKKAMECYRKVFSLNPSDPDAPRAMKDLAALTTIERGGWATAKSSRDVIKDRDKAVELEKAGQLVKGDVDGEIKRLEAIIDENPDSPQNIVSLKKIGELYIQKKKYDKALETYQKAAKISPSDGMLAMRIGDIKIMNFDKEIAQLQKEATMNPDNQALKTKADALKAEKRKFQIEEYRSRVKAHPTDMTLHFQLATALYAAGEIDEAITEFQMAARDPKRRVASYRYLGEAFIRKKHYDLAITQFKKSLEAGALTTEQTKELRYLLARAYEDNKNIKEAVEEFKKILEIDFNYKDASKKVEKYKDFA
ncbi:MAG: tetratricopeptide repeat protein [Planctomycetes bacterium]|nr:tetratricopeptide repeat protein [Planctomycetota bacterium]